MKITEGEKTEKTRPRLDFPVVALFFAFVSAGGDGEI